MDLPHEASHTTTGIYSPLATNRNSQARFSEVLEVFQEAQKDTRFRPTRHQFLACFELLNQTIEDLNDARENSARLQQDLETAIDIRRTLSETITGLERRLEDKFTKYCQELVAQHQGQSLAPQCNQPPTYSQVAARKIKPAIQKQQEAPLILAPKEKSTVTSIADIANSDVDVGFTKVNRVRKTKAGNVMVVASSQSEREALKQRLLASSSLSAKYKIREPRQMNPRLVISNISPLAYKDDNQLKRDIYERNDHINSTFSHESFQSAFRILYHPKEDRYGNKSIVVDVPAQLRTCMLSSPLYLAWQIADVSDYLYVVRCYKCQRYGHSTRSCTHNEYCSFCGENNHNYKTCPIKNDPSKYCCINCWRYNQANPDKTRPTDHTAVSSECPELKHVKELTFNSTNYGF